ncbi:ZIP family metal transporter [Candidatus Falkowbacteria bacterium]|nr:ZIP family metal transporter [Candidatus Falkowbacteria bacterium]
MNPLFWIIASTFVISLLSFVGVLALVLKEKWLEKILLTLVSLASGALMGGAFLHLLPEAIEKADSRTVFLWVLIAFAAFFVIEKIFQWRHCHREHCEIHTFGYMSLLGDSVHNFIDGLIVAASFVEGTRLGLIVSVAVILHEIPQEFGDFGTLLFAGFKKKTAILMNFLTALTAIAGGMIGFFWASYSDNFIKILLPFAAGGFIYIAASDLIPEIRKTVKFKESISTFVVFLIGIGFIYLMKFLDVE